MKKLVKRYVFFLITITMLLILLAINFEIGKKSFFITINSLKEMILIIPPIFILLGLLDIWISKETMTKHLGEKSGLKGIFLAIFIGSAAAGPLYGAFPIATVFMKKGVKFKNIIIFLGAWSTTKIPMFLFEMSSLGAKFAITRLIVDIFGIIIIAEILNKIISDEEKIKIYKNTQNF
ncbi:putative permease [Hypnocyclicus thermotrophus]|uniref:Permease n=1 Tax=Hypnocyclicus thermotrophus TaxID=1627895 RepID=A0AA46I6M0_9FUSO|nr:permease [Hypnocyclicus thermotrophus]TDT72492.1 putative permease [Hypnocyclicus thermotrophus]